MGHESHTTVRRRERSTSAIVDRDAALTLVALCLLAAGIGNGRVAHSVFPADDAIAELPRLATAHVLADVIAVAFPCRAIFAQEHFASAPRDEHPRVAVADDVGELPALCHWDARQRFRT